MLSHFLVALRRIISKRICFGNKSKISKTCQDHPILVNPTEKWLKELVDAAPPPPKKGDYITRKAIHDAFDRLASLQTRPH